MAEEVYWMVEGFSGWPMGFFLEGGGEFLMSMGVFLRRWGFFLWQPKHFLNDRSARGCGLVCTREPYVNIAAELPGG